MVFTQTEKADVSAGWVGPAAPRQGQKKIELYLAGNQLGVVTVVVDTRVKPGACLVIFSSKSFPIFTENRLGIRRIERQKYASIYTDGRSNRLFWKVTLQKTVTFKPK